MKLRSAISLLTLGLSATVSSYAVGYDELPNIRVLFVDLVDASQCLQITPENCEDLYAKSTQYDVAKWIGTLFCRPPQLDTCEACYSHIDGKNIIGVLPIVHEVLREPSILHATTGSKALTNHYINDWGTLSTGSGHTFQESALSWYSRDVSNATIKGWASPTPTVALVSQSVALTSSRNPARTALAYTNNNLLLTVPESLLTETINSPVVNIPLPSIVNLSSPRAYNPLRGAYDNSPTYSFNGSTYNSVNPSTSNGAVVSRPDPVSTDGSNSMAGIYYPAKRYTYAGDATRLSSANLTQCGVKYEVIARGAVNPEFLKAYATEYARAGSFAPTSGVTLNGVKTAVTGNKGSFNAVTGLWSGATTYIPYDNLPTLDASNTTNLLASTSLTSRISDLNSALQTIWTSQGLDQNKINKNVPIDSAPTTANP